MQNGMNHASCSSTTRDLREHKKNTRSRHVLIIKEEVHQNEEDQQKLVMTKVNASSCGESAGKEGLQEASTFQLNENVSRAAILIVDMQLLGRLCAGDKVALEYIQITY